MFQVIPQVVLKSRKFLQLFFFFSAWFFCVEIDKNHLKSTFPSNYNHHLSKMLPLHLLAPSPEALNNFTHLKSIEYVAVDTILINTSPINLLKRQRAFVWIELLYYLFSSIPSDFFSSLLHISLSKNFFITFFSDCAILCFNSSSVEVEQWNKSVRRKALKIS